MRARAGVSSLSGHVHAPPDKSAVRGCRFVIVSGEVRSHSSVTSEPNLPFKAETEELLDAPTPPSLCG